MNTNHEANSDTTRMSRLLATPLGQKILRDAEQSAALAAKRKRAIARLKELTQTRRQRSGCEGRDSKLNEARQKFEEALRNLEIARHEQVNAVCDVREWENDIDKEINQLTVFLRSSAPAAVKEELAALPTDIEVIRDPTYSTSAERNAALEAVKRLRTELNERLLTEVDETNRISS